MTVISASPQSIATPVPKRSWADIVQGRSETKVQPLRPAERGSHRCLCTGEFLVMLGHYGWIKALQDIDHPDADRHGGRIYLKANDLRPGAAPKQGDEVTFFLYSDSSGLGAEDCYVTSDPHPPQPPKVIRSKNVRRVWSEPKPQPQPKPQSLSADAQEFVPIVLVPLNQPAELNPDAQDFVPPPPGLGLLTEPVMNAEAAEFVPCTTLSSRRGFDMCTINTKCFFDDDDSSDDDTESTCSDLSGRVLVAPGLATCFVSKQGGQPEEWSTLSSRCAQAVVVSDGDGNSWYDDDSDDEDSQHLSSAQEWSSVSARCAEAVSKVEHPHSWHSRTTAAAAKLRADVGNDIRWDVMLDALAELDEAPVERNYPLLPPGLAPPGLA